MICLILFVFQNFLLFHPSSDPELAESLDTNTEIRTVSLATEAGKTVGRITGSGSCLVMYFGGNAENTEYLFLDYMRPDMNCAFSSMNYRGYGKSDGRPREKNMHQDALAWYDEMERLYHPKTKILMGRSLGTNVAIYVADNRKTDRLVLVTPYDSIANVALSKYPFVPVPWLIFDAFDSTKIVPNLKIPTLVLVAERDDVVPGKSTEALL